MSDTIRSRPQSDEYDEGYERTFGKDRKPVRGRWVITPEGLVPADEYQAPERAVNAPVLMDRFYEGVKAPDGADIGSRRKHRQYMKERGLAPASDYSDGWYASKRAEQKREADKSRREAVARAVYEKFKP